MKNSGHTGSNPQLSDDILGGPTGLTLRQDLDPRPRGNMVRRLPSAFRSKLYYQYKKQFGLPGSAFTDVLEQARDEDPEGFKRREGGEFERRVAMQEDLPEVVAKCVRATVLWPAVTQSLKGPLTAGMGKGWRYWREKREKGRKG